MREVRALGWAGMLVLAIAAASGCGTSIHDAAGAGDMDSVRAALERRPELVNEKSQRLRKTPLDYAITYGHYDVVCLLVERGADVRAADKTGLTPLHVAAFRSNPRAASLLLKNGADIEARDEFGDTPLHSAAMHNMSGMIRALVRWGADMEARNLEGLTPLQLARKLGNTKAVEQLDKLGAADSHNSPAQNP